LWIPLKKFIRLDEDEKSFAGNRENPYVIFLIMEPPADFMDWKGIRVYLKAQNISTIGPVLDTYKAEMAKIAGELAQK
jgi:hypothetical protein